MAVSPPMANTRSWALLARRIFASPPHAVNARTRTSNLAMSLLLAAGSLPLFALIYLLLGDALAASFCAVAMLGIGASALVLHRFGRIALARNTLTLTMFLLLLALIYRIGGARSPSVIWLAVCPIVASAGGGARSGMYWSMLVMLTMIGINFVDVGGHFPAPVIADLRALHLIGNESFVLLVAVFLLVYERNNALALRQLGEAMETIQLMAVSDELTGLNNRRELLRIAHQEKLRADRYGSPLSYCLIDIDHFKVVNDTWGHLTGDEVLRGVASALAALVRATDCVGRYGGEEFVLVLSGTDRFGAREFAERVRIAIEELTFEQLDGKRITLSIGVAQDLPSQSVEQGLARADAALYLAKRSGRNRVEVSAC